MKLIVPGVLLVSAGALGLALPALANGGGAGDVVRGRVLFMQCAACHSVTEGEPHKIGPNLHDIVDAPMGQQEEFAYSPAMAEAGAAGRTWSRETLDAFLADPRATLPDNRMTYGGIADATKRSDIIAYLESL